MPLRAHHGWQTLWSCSGVPRALGHPLLVLVVERKPKGIAEGGERPFGGVGLRRLERDIMRRLCRRRRPKPVPMPSRTMTVSPARTVMRTLVE